MNEDKTLVIRGNVVDIIERRIYGAEITLQNGHILRIVPTGKEEESYLLPGFIDAHIHIESSMVTPAAFINAAVCHGTIGTVADPHEIANVAGTDGIQFMLDNVKGIPFYAWFGVPSCVPTTKMETSGACINADETARLLQQDNLHFLGEMMDYPSILNGDPETLRKLEVALILHKPIDGHYPIGTGASLEKYIHAGISTDHEASSLKEAKEKCDLGMKIQIREGSAARDFDKLLPLLKEYPEQIMFCSDDIHPGVLQEGHINVLVKKALERGYDLYDVLRAAAYNPAQHYNIPVGFLREGDAADFIEVNNLKDLEIRRTYIQGELVFNGTGCTIPFQKPSPCNRFHAKPITLEKLSVKAKGKQMRVIVCRDRELATTMEIHPVHTSDGFVESDPERDLLKLIVVNRYQKAPPAIAFIKGTGLKLGAVAQSISHDSHNIIAVGVTDYELEQAINAVIRAKGGIAVSLMDEITLFPLPIAGLMSDLTVEEVSRDYQKIEKKIKALHTPMESLQMTLSFMGLLVIPSLKLSDKGLFDSDNFTYTSLFV